MIQQTSVGPMLALRPHFAAQSAESLKQFDNGMQKLAREIPRAQKESTLRFGVSCWHKSDHESEAMWKLYSASGQAIAIESTVGQLRSSLGSREGVIITRCEVRRF